MEDTHIISRRNHRAALAFGLLLAVATFLALPASAFGANSLVQSGPYAPCAQDTAGGSADWTNCLPSGRWGRSVGVVMTRQEPAEGILNKMQNMGSNISTTMRLMVPNMMLTICQVLWSVSLGVSQFAASFEPLNSMGRSVDHAAGQLADQLTAGSLPTWFLVIGLCAGLWALVFKSQEEGKSILRRCLVSVLCLATVLVMGGAASQSTDSAPATGSPWWVVKNINDTVNTMAVGLNMDGINDDPSMMSYSGGKDGNCQRYLYEMNRQYMGADGGPAAPKNQSNVVTAVDRLWQETALRSYVTMQWGNPKAGGPSNAHVADNAQQAYCHVLEASAGTPVGVQKDLSNRAMGTNINDRTAQYLFDTRGWITTTDTSVNTSDKAKDSDETTKLDRMGVFWETCTADQGQVHSRGGWNKLINNLSDDGSGSIEGAGKNNTLRIARGGKSGDNWEKIAPSDDNRIMIAGQDYTGSTDALCSRVFNNQVWNNYEGNTPKEPTGGDNDKSYVDTNLGDSAAMGWRFDVPNVGGTWREANMYNEDPATVNGSVPTTLNYLYGTSKVDTVGAIGSVLGGLVNLLVWGLFGLILILAKTMLMLMGLLLIPALIAAALPVGGNRHIIKSWTLFNINLSAMSIMYGFLATLATFVCQTMLKAVSSMSGTFFYQILAGISPLLSLLIISIFCVKILHIGNPFSPRSMLKIAGGGALASGVQTLANRGLRMAMYKHIANGGRNRKGNGKGKGKDKGTRDRQGTGSGTDSSDIADEASRQQDAGPGTSPGDGTAPSQQGGAYPPGSPDAPDTGEEGPYGQDDPEAPAPSAGPQEDDGTGRPRIPLRRFSVRGTAKGALKVGLLGGAAALGGTALALPAALVMAGTIAAKGLRNGLRNGLRPPEKPADHAGGGPEADPPAPLDGRGGSGNLGSGMTADDAALEQDGRIAMGVHPETDPLDVESTHVGSSHFDAPKPLAHEPKPAWDKSDPKKSAQAWAEWSARERETDSLMRDENQRRRRGIQ